MYYQQIGYGHVVSKQLENSYSLYDELDLSESVRGIFLVLSRSSTGVTEENFRSSAKIVGVSSEIRTACLPNTSQLLYCRNIAGSWCYDLLD